MESRPITNTQNLINSRDLFARIKWLEQELNYRCSDEYSEELKALKSFVENIQANASASTYEQGADLIRDSYFQEYAKAREESDAPDAPRAAFSPVDFNGIIYWLRHVS
ncbi:hypothetical protein SAMN05216420_104210 [Nitrosospira sp. Nl5]|uniref:hypothetical protein n=1 Tax=Nitrosospira sp. Nl5 TaxID=200120 RepID=UPI000890397E|nr:hypothetical protein [Nitrosospira sp. Nl5]SCY31441.1 hypothetical protein SAMN05216420_104210 [Nitrosospira sp. Nl5]